MSAVLKPHDTSTYLSYLINLEQENECRYEMQDGNTYAMAGASGKHNIITGNLARLFGNHLLHTNCIPFGGDMRLKIDDANFFYPDLSVDCDYTDNENFLTSPILIVEVLSFTTRKNDATDKFKRYQKLSSLQEYVLIEQDFMKVTVYQKEKNWKNPNEFFKDDEVTLQSIKLTLPIADIYYRVGL